MKLLDLSWRNVRRNFRIYSIYLISMIIVVVIQYTFSSLIFNEDVLAALENEENFQVGLIAASIVVFLFIIFFILYANTFFMNQRKKEFDYAVQLDGSTKNFPNDIAFESQDEHIQHQIETLIHESNHPVITHETIEGILVNPVTNRDVAFEQSDYLTEDILLFSETQFNDIVALRGDDQEVNLHGQEAIVLSKIDTPKQFTQDDQSEFTVKVGDESTFHLIERKDYALLGPASNLSNTNVFLHLAIFIISDEAYATIQNSQNTQMYELYQIENAKDASALSAQIQAIVSQSPDIYYSAFADGYAIQAESSALLLFTAAFLAVIAVFALGSIIYFKQLREATDEQKQYAILRKIGVSNTEMKKVIRKKLLFVFLPPLILGMLHSLFIMNYSIFEEVRDFPQLTSIMWAILIIYFVIYFLFYVSSTNLYYKIVNQQK